MSLPVPGRPRRFVLPREVMALVDPTERWSDPHPGLVLWWVLMDDGSWWAMTKWATQAAVAHGGSPRVHDQLLPMTSVAPLSGGPPPLGETRLQQAEREQHERASTTKAPPPPRG
jgi:hypothetical protein